MKQQHNSWEEEFDKEWNALKHSKTGNDIKSFIQNLLDNQKKELVERIEKGGVEEIVLNTLVLREKGVITSFQLKMAAKIVKEEVLSLLQDK